MQLTQWLSKFREATLLTQKSIYFTWRRRVSPECHHHIAMVLLQLQQYKK